MYATICDDHLFGTLLQAHPHAHKLAQRQRDVDFFLPGWAPDVRTCYKSPLPFLLVSQTLAVSDTRVKLTSICVARVGHSSRPRHATGQRQRAARTQKPPDTCFCVSYHFSIICISFISQTRSSELTLSEHRGTGWWNIVICGSLTEISCNMRRCTFGFIVCDDTMEEMNWSWVSRVNVRCCYHFGLY